MGLKNCKGITLLALVVTVIVLLIIATISMNYGTEVLEKTKLDSIKTNMLLIEAKAKLYAEEYNFSGDISSLHGTKVSSTTDVNVLEYNASVGNKYSNYYYVNPSTLSEMGLNIRDGHYLVNYDINNMEVVYIEGVQVGENVYHTLTELRNLE